MILSLEYYEILGILVIGIFVGLLTSFVVGRSMKSTKQSNQMSNSNRNKNTQTKKNIKFPYVLGICGGSGSGKTTVCEKIVEMFESQFGGDDDGLLDVVVISQDSYYKPASAKSNFDVPKSIDWDLLNKHINQLKNGESIECPVYNFTTHSRESYTKTVHPAKIIIIEGILIFCNPTLRKLMDKKIFIDAGLATMVFRRINRDIKSRGRKLADIEEQYLKHVEKAYFKYVLPSRRYAGVTIHNHNGQYTNLDILLDHLAHTVFMNSNAKYQNEIRKRVKPMIKQSESKTESMETESSVSNTNKTFESDIHQ
jgi:uridine kinase